VTRSAAVAAAVGQQVSGFWHGSILIDARTCVFNSPPLLRYAVATQACLLNSAYSLDILCTYITSCYINGSDSDHGQVQGRGPDPDPSPVSDPGAGAFFATAQPLVVSPVFFAIVRGL